MNNYLNPKIFKDIEKVPIRNGFGEGFLELGKMNEKVVGLCADLTESTRMHKFAEAFPERFVEIGVAEQNLATVASGMAAMGKIPYITSYAMFSPGRNWEQIRTTICYNDRPVKIVGSHAGISVGPDGGTHQAVEDIAITRVIPRMIVLSPCDHVEAKKATIAAADTGTPVYIRLARNATPVITKGDTPFEIGKAKVFFETKGRKPDVGIIATGALVYKALKVAQDLQHIGIWATVLNLSTIKPLDERAILELAREANAIVTIEEHQISGGMGSAVSEFISQKHPVPMEFIGVHDKFGQSGDQEQLLEYYGMGEDHIRDAVMKVIKRKEE